jgi:peptide/nickel transport system permease protein
VSELLQQRDGQSTEICRLARTGPTPAATRTTAVSRPGSDGLSTEPSALGAMIQFVLRRLGLAGITLGLASVIVYVGAALIPGDIGRDVLGPYATQQAVDVYDRQLGLDRPIVVRYGDWLSHFVRGDLGISYQYKVPVADLLGPAMLNSFKLAAFAMVMIIPISILGGVIAALRRDRLADRVISFVGLSMTAIPEFVSGVVLITVFGIWAKVVPVTAAAPPGAGILTQLDHLILPAASLALVYFGYLSRMARAGVIEALDADFTRTARLNGLALATVIRRHVLRNALLPTVSVIATQVGFVLGGLVVIETVFNYNGLGQRLYVAALNKDYVVMQSGAMVTGVIIVTCTLLGDITLACLDPRIRTIVRAGARRRRQTRRTGP